MRNKIITLLVILAIFIMPTTASSTLTATPANTQITINGKTVQGVYINDKLYLPARDTFEKASWEVSYTPSKTEITSPEYIAEQCKRSCVYIKADKANSYMNGSGVFLNDNYIVTVYHVVEGTNKITITDQSQNQQEVILYKYDKEKDIAILKTKYNRDNAKIGKYKGDEKVVAVTSPRGVINISSFGEGRGHNGRFINLGVQIYPGSSGGGIFNMKGELIGICKEASGWLVNAVPIEEFNDYLK